MNSEKVTSQVDAPCSGGGERYATPELASFLQRPDSMRGRLVCIRGKVLEIESAADGSLIIVEMETPWGGMPNEVAVGYPERMEGLAVGEEICVWGRCLGTHVHASFNCGVTSRTHVAADFIERRLG